MIHSSESELCILVSAVKLHCVCSLCYYSSLLPISPSANFHIPAKDNVFEDVLFTEIYGQAANKIVQQYKDDALGLPSYPQNKRTRYDRYDRPPGGSPGRFGPPRLGGGLVSGCMYVILELCSAFPHNSHTRTTHTLDSQSQSVWLS